jgi:ABC-2 type transport system permease protein
MTLTNILGKNYKWWHILQFYGKSTGSGIFGFLLMQVSDILQILAIIYIWLLNNSSPQIITYLIIGRIYKACTDTFFSELLGPEIINGNITKHLIIPQSYFKISLFRELGRRVIFNIARASVYLIAVGIFYKDIDWSYFNISNISLLLVFMPITFISTFIIEIIVGSQAFFIRDKRTFTGIWNAYNGIAGVLSGLLIPLDKLPFYSIIQFLPTSWILHHPMQIYLGKYDTNQTILVFLGGLAWCVVLYILAKIVFKLGLKRNESVGL